MMPFGNDEQRDHEVSLPPPLELESAPLDFLLGEQPLQDEPQLDPTRTAIRSQQCSRLKALPGWREAGSG